MSIEQFNQAVEFRIDLQTRSAERAQEMADYIGAAIFKALADLGQGEIVFTEDYTF